MKSRIYVYCYEFQTKKRAKLTDGEARILPAGDYHGGLGPLHPQTALAAKRRRQEKVGQLSRLLK